MKMTSTPLSEARVKTHRQWLIDWSEGLGYCLNCAEEYTDQETVIIDGEKNCPHCKTDYEKRYYYCNDHGSSDDDCER